MTTEKLPPKRAAIQAMEEVAGPVIAIVLVLSAVFIPVGFLGGLSGVMYRQFAITIAVSVVISGIVALTLTPALCALILKPTHGEPLLRSEEHTSELQSLMRISYAVFCLKTKTKYIYVIHCLNNKT